MKICMLALGALLIFSPGAAFAQGYSGVMPAQDGAHDSSAYAPASSDDTDSDVDHGYSAQDNPYDQAYKTDKNAPTDLYQYVNKNQMDTPDKRREAAEKEVTAKRDAMIAKMKANSAKMLKEQNERAWKIAHPGQEYPEDSDGEDNADDNSAGDTTADTGGEGDTTDGDSDSDGGGDAVSDGDSSGAGNGGSSYGSSGVTSGDPEQQ